MQYTNSEIERKISEQIHSDRDRRIMRMRLVDGMTAERIAEQTAMSTVQIYRIIKKCRKMIEN